MCSYQHPRIIYKTDNFNEIIPPSIKKRYDLVLAELKQIQNVKSTMQETKSHQDNNKSEPITKANDDGLTRLEFLKRRAHFLENQILTDLKLLKDLHQEELVVIKEEFKSKTVDHHYKMEAYFRKQKCRMENVVRQYALKMLEMDECGENIEKMLTQMMDELGREAEIEIWGENKNSKLKKIRKVFTRLISFFK